MGDPASNRGRRGLLAALALAVLVSGCSGEVTRHGYIAEEGALSQIELGASREQVRLIMGTPTTTAAIGNEVYFYISETKERFLFLEPEVTDRRVLTFYFGDDGRLERIANYGLQDGKVFDFITRTTPTRGDDLTVLRQIFGNLGNVNPFNR